MFYTLHKNRFWTVCSAFKRKKKLNKGKAKTKFTFCTPTFLGIESVGLFAHLYLHKIIWCFSFLSWWREKTRERKVCLRRYRFFSWFHTKLKLDFGYIYAILWCDFESEVWHRKADLSYVQIEIWSQSRKIIEIVKKQQHVEKHSFWWIHHKSAHNSALSWTNLT